MSSLQETTTVSTLGPGNEDDLPDIQWGADTDYLFNEDVLPKLSNKETNARILGRLLRQKLIHRIKLQTGREPSKRTTGLPNPFVSDPGSPNFYEWRFTPEYTGFPLRSLAAWTQPQIRECNSALENGDLYLVDVRNPGLRPPPQAGITSSRRASGSRAVGIGEPDGNQLRKKLVNVAEAAFTKYIRQKTGISEFSYKDILLGNVGKQAAGLRGWRWVFPVHGVITNFPANNSFWSWTTDELLYALHGLLTKTLRLEQEFSSIDTDMEARQLEETHQLQQELLPFTRYREIESPEPERAPEIQYPPPRYSAPQQVGNDYIRPIHIDSPAPGMVISQPVASLNGAAQIQDSGNGDIGLDDLVVQLSRRSQKWKDDQKQLQECIQREQSLIVTNADQAARIKELEGALTRIKDLDAALSKKNVSDAPVISLQSLHTAVNLQGAMKGMEAYHSAELSDLRAQNEELKEVIKDQETQVQDADFLRERNRFLEAQLAEKTAEASSAYEALAAIAGGGPSNSATQPQNLANAVSSSTHVSAPPRTPNGRPPKTSNLPQSTANEQPRPQTQMTNSGVLPCDRCKAYNLPCEEPGSSCIRCRKIGQICTFNMTNMDKFLSTASAGLSISDAVSMARKVTEETAQFLKNKAVVTASYVDNLQGQYRPQGQYPPQTVYPPHTQYDTQSQFPRQTQYLPQGHKAWHSDATPTRMHVTAHQGQEWQAIGGFYGGRSKNVRMGDYQSPYTIDDEY